MRQLISILSVSFLLACGPDNTSQSELDAKEKTIALDTAQKESGPSNDNSIEQLIADIRAEFGRINSLPLTTKKYNFVCDTDGTITYYADNKEVKKVSINWGFVGHGSLNSEYYFKDGKLIFVYESFFGGPANGPDTKTEYRTYVNNDKSIRYMEDQKITACTTCEFNKSSREYKVLEAFSTNNFNAALCN